jgi:hypothetical protein
MDGFAFVNLEKFSDFMHVPVPAAGFLQVFGHAQAYWPSQHSCKCECIRRNQDA